MFDWVAYPVWIYRHRTQFIATKWPVLSLQNTQFATQFERTEPISQSDDWLVCHKRVTESLEHPVLHPVAPR